MQLKKDQLTFVMCWKFEYKTNVKKINHSKYENGTFDKCYTGKSKEKEKDGKEWLCKTCDGSLKKKNAYASPS